MNLKEVVANEIFLVFGEIKQLPRVSDISYVAEIQNRSWIAIPLGIKECLCVNNPNLGDGGLWADYF